ncbi:hypothetical protein [Baaleninema sp.]|uniref:hypothetical protein n=1 Tax=Baaleninema sp. TaxID=3101197 RepID=UPI003CFF658F
MSSFDLEKFSERGDRFGENSKLTLLKSTEPYLDEYFALDMDGELTPIGFETPTTDINSPGHKTVIARKP